jgi:hypothetical protein
MSGSNRKFGRNKKRPSNMRYTAEKRWIKNKATAIKREARRVAKCALRKLLRLPESSRDYARISHLRQVISQNLTG